MHRYFLKIFGCQMNYADAQRLAAVFEKLGWKEGKEEDNSDCVILVTCSVKKKAEDRAFGLLKDLAEWKKQKSGRLVGLAGCMVRLTSSQTDSKKDPLLRNHPVLDFVLRAEDAPKLGELLVPAQPGLRNNPELTPDEKIVAFFKIKPAFHKSSKLEAKSSKLIPIMTGCDNFCSYCIVPYARGRERSRPAEDVVQECTAAVAAGALEITLLGQNVNSYQKTPGAFAALLRKVAEIRGLRRLRFMSSHPKDFDESVIQVMKKYPNIERHLHLPIQHADNEILEKMNRKYTAGEYLAKLKKFREVLPEASITTDLIVGFPGETEKAFANLLKLYKKADFDFAYFSQYSPRPGTAAFRMKDDVGRKEKSARWHALNNLVVSTTAKKYKKYKDKTLEVLVERCSQGICLGRSSEFCLTKFKGSKDLIGKIVKVKITQPREVELWGELVHSS